MKIGIFNGSFNPIHKAHLEIGKIILEKKLVDKIIFVPTGDLYKKNALLKASKRLDMIRLAIKEKKKMSVSDLEIKKGKLYTYQTLDYFQKTYPKDEIYLIMGFDNLEDFQNWKNYQYILKNYSLIIFERNGKKLKDLREYSNLNNIHFIDYNNKINATDIRSLLKDKKYQKAKEYLDNDVYNYIIENHLYEGDKMEKIEEQIYLKLKKNNYKIATAESFTGGLVAATLINVAGASDIMDMSFVTYSNESKIDLLGVKKTTIDKYSVVSEEVAKEMALGIKKRAKCEVGISTTGYAGPTGVDVGLVCFAIALNDKVYTFKHRFNSKSRSYIRKESVKFILEKLNELI